MGVVSSLCCCKNSVHPLGSTGALQLLYKMTCESCGVRFSFLKKKKRCRECQKDFCSACLMREAGPRHLLCQTCRVLTAVPLDHSELMKLRVRELRHFLAQHDVPIDSCTEKTDLVDLIIRMPRQQASSESTTSSNEEPPSSERSFFGFTPPAFDFTPPAFPSFSFSPMRSSSVFQSSSPSSRGRTEHTATSVPPQPQSTDSIFNPEFLWNDLSSPAPESGEPSCHDFFTGLSSSSFNFRSPSPLRFRFGHTSPQNFFSPFSSPETSPLHSPEPSAPPSPEPSPAPSPEPSALPSPEPSPAPSPEPSSPPSPEPSPVLSHESSPQPSSQIFPEPFYQPNRTQKCAQEPAENLTTKKIRIEDMLEVNAEELSSRQLKEILSRSFVAYRGVCEKAELIEKVKRLQEEVRENQRRAELGLPEENLCKICMDAPVDCVLLECGHMLSCTQCGRLLNECPVCRQYVIRVVHTFRA